MSQYLKGQVHQLAEALQEHGFTPADVTALGQNSNGVLDQVKLVLMGLVIIVRAYFRLALDKAFNPAELIGKDWKVWRGSADGDGLEGDEDCVAEPDTVDFEQIVLETHLQGDETSVLGEEKMKRSRSSKNRQFGGRASLALWNDWVVCKAAGRPEDSILEKLRRAKKIGNIIYFFGLTLRDPDGRRHVLDFCFADGKWGWYCHWLGRRWSAVSPSAALASVGTQS